LVPSYCFIFQSKESLIEVGTLGIGEILWEGKGRTQIMIVRNVDAGGVEVEFTWSGDVKGRGKAKGVDGTIVFTGRKLAPLSGLGKGTTTGQGLMFTSKDMVAIKSSGYGNPKWKRTKSVELWSFLTSSRKLKWINEIVAVVTQEGDPAWKEFEIEINEWKQE